MKKIVTLLLVLVAGVAYTQAPTPVLRTFKKKFSRVKDVKWTKTKVISDTISEVYNASFTYRDKPTTITYSPNGYWIETTTQLEEKELRSGITKYIYENHYSDDLDLAKRVQRYDKNDYFYVRMKRMEKGQFRPYFFELWFNRSGKIQKIKRPESLKSKYLLTEEIPENIAKKFSSKYHKPSDAKWHEKDGMYVCEFTYRTVPMTAYYSKDSAQWVKTIEEPDVRKGRLYSPVVRVIEKKYPKYKIISYQKITAADKAKSGFKVKIKAKKKKTSPQEIDLKFDKRGKLND